MIGRTEIGRRIAAESTVLDTIYQCRVTGSDMLRETVTALTRSADAVGVLVVGGLLTLLAWVLTPVWIGGTLLFPPLALFAPLALAPAFVARGYLVRVLAAGIATGNADGAPPFVAWNQLYRDGLKAALLSAVLLAPLGLGVAIAALALGALQSGFVGLAPVADTVRAALGDGGTTVVAGLSGGIVGTAVAAYLLAFAYVRPAALAAFAASGRLRDGLRPSRVAGVAGSGAYATAWLVAAGTLGAGYALAGPFVPLVVGAALVFVVRVAVYGLYGRGAGATLVATEAGGGDAAADSTASEAARRSVPHGRPPSPEVPPAVQTGRTVPIGGTGAVGADGGFDWGAPDGERVDGDASDPRDAAGDGFEWAVDVADPEDKY